jgi:hypothetical protein
MGAGLLGEVTPSNASKAGPQVKPIYCAILEGSGMVSPTGICGVVARAKVIFAAFGLVVSEVAETEELKNAEKANPFE